MGKRNQSNKTVNIPIRLVSGQIETVYDTPLTWLRGGAVGDFVVPESDVTNEAVVNILQAQVEVEMLPKGAVVYMRVNASKIPPELVREAVPLNILRTAEFPEAEYRFVRVNLQSPLLLHLRGSKKPDLLDCGCIIPALGNQKADSLNQAYSLVSRVFEPWRRSHAGNIFQRAYYPIDKSQWAWLEDLRQRKETRFETFIRLGLLYQAIIEERRDQLSLRRQHFVSGALDAQTMAVAQYLVSCNEIDSVDHRL